MDNPLTDKEFRELALKCQEGTATEAEQETFNQAYYQLLKRHAAWDSELMGDEEPVKSKIFNNLMEQVELYQKRKRRFTIYKYASAAIIILTAGFGAFFYLNQTKHKEQSAKFVNNIQPGGNKAYLILADGKKISLTDAANGEIAKQAGVRISKAEDGQLVYTLTNSQPLTTGSELIYNIIETPKGGQYQLRLPDGSRVWLNAATTLKFPASFAAIKERRVELSGEAYFEVAKDKSHPFIVKTDKQEVEVLGTHFNINSYAGETDTKTTLLEGLVRINRATVLKPGEQALLNSSGKLQVRTVDTELAVAWKNGNFMFESEGIESIMKKIARWYDVDIEYRGQKPSEQYNGITSRGKNVSQILSILEKTGTVHFQIEGKKIIVSTP